MAFVVADRVKETTTTTGQGTVTLSGASAGFQSFAAVGNGNTTYYCIAAQTGTEWEVGIGTYTASGTTLSRDSVFSSSAGGTTKTTFSAGTKDVFVTYPAEMASFSAAGAVTENYTTFTGTYTMTTGKNGFSVGPVTVSSGSSFTVPSGQRWLVV
jgi:hypothetical protein